MPQLDCIKSISYICFISAYAFYIRTKMYDKRIIRSQIIIMVLLIAWNILKVVRWQSNVEEDLRNVLWYLYYIPMIFIPITYFYLFYSINYDTSKLKRIIVTIIVSIGVALSAIILTNNEHGLIFIADVLCVSETTIKTHLAKLFSKTNTRNRTELAIYAVTNGFVKKVNK